ncbi:MAG: type II toxin-antitoxin system antitoxin, RelB/DinJ family, partial [Spirosomataceae bacterium]
RLFFKQVVITKSIPFSIENQNINLEQLIRLRKLKQNEAKTEQNALSSSALNLLDDQEIQLDDDHLDLFEELNAILGESDKI